MNKLPVVFALVAFASATALRGGGEPRKLSVDISKGLAAVRDTADWVFPAYVGGRFTVCNDDTKPAYFMVYDTNDNIAGDRMSVSRDEGRVLPGKCETFTCKQEIGVSKCKVFYAGATKAGCQPACSDSNKLGGELGKAYTFNTGAHGPYFTPLPKWQ